MLSKNPDTASAHQPTSSRWGLLILFAIIILGCIGLYFLFQQPTQRELTLVQLEERATSLNPYLPEGYIVTQEAERIEDKSSVSYRTTLSNGQQNIYISLALGQRMQCTGQLKIHGTRKFCLQRSENKLLVTTSNNGIIYTVESDATGITYDLLEQVQEGL